MKNVVRRLWRLIENEGTTPPPPSIFDEADIKELERAESLRGDQRAALENKHLTKRGKRK